MNSKNNRKNHRRTLGENRSSRMGVGRRRERELYWQKQWSVAHLYEPDLKRARRSFYNLMMFPYPSAEGLHVGHAYAFSGADSFGRFKKMAGYDVFEPMGFDAFGIHSENYALKVGLHPKNLMAKTTDRYRTQIKSLGTMHDWSRELSTTDPDYYRWTQWLFLQLFKAGLAVRKKAQVNWCPSCKTVLADEQVVQKGLDSRRQNQSGGSPETERIGVCERCQTPVTVKYLEQWFLRITRYAGRLWRNLETIDWSQRVKNLQRNWIGRSPGAYISFPVAGQTFALRVFTTRPDTLFGATFVAVAAEHSRLEQLVIKSQRPAVNAFLTRRRPAGGGGHLRPTGAGVFTGSYAVNPATKQRLPIWMADFVLAHYGRGAVMGVPAHDRRDFDFARRHELPIKKVITPTVIKRSKKARNNQAAATEPRPDSEECYPLEGWLIDSGPFTGMNSREARQAIIRWLAAEKKGRRAVTYRLRDWLISRQRYWGPPIPIIYCRQCRRRKVHQPNSGLKDQKSAPESEKEGVDYAVINGEQYAIVPIPEKDLPVRLPHLENYQPTGSEKGPLEQAEDWVRVKCPNCGAEARREVDVSDTFLDSAWYFLRYPTIGSPRAGRAAFDPALTRKWLPVDMYIGGPEHAVLHLLYARFITMALHDLGRLDFEEPFKKFRAHGLITKDGAKMSKSRGNVVNPDDYIDRYGADVLRLYLLFLGPFGQGGDFSDKGISGAVRFLERVEKLVNRQLNNGKNGRPKETPALARRMHQTIKRVTTDLERLKFNTAIAALMSLTNEFYALPEVTLDSLKVLVRLLAPLAPHTAEELWARLQGTSEAGWRPKHSVFKAAWPEHDPDYLREEVATIIVQVNGKLRDQFSITVGATDEEVKTQALAREKIKKWTQDGKIDKVIYIPEKLVNIVVKE